MLTAIHRFGDLACKRVAFYYDEDGAPQDRIEAERVRLLDDTTPQPGTTMQCGSCGAELPLDAIDLLPGELNVRAN